MARRKVSLFIITFGVFSLCLGTSGESKKDATTPSVESQSDYRPHGSIPLETIQDPDIEIKMTPLPIVSTTTEYYDGKIKEFITEYQPGSPTMPSIIDARPKLGSLPKLSTKSEVNKRPRDKHVAGDDTRTEPLDPKRQPRASGNTLLANRSSAKGKSLRSKPDLESSDFNLDDESGLDNESGSEWMEKMQNDFVPIGGQVRRGMGGNKRKSKRKRKKGDRMQDDEDFDMNNYSNEYRIKQKLLRYYDKTTRPVVNDSQTITMFIGMSLYHILDTNEKMQTLSALIAVRCRWMDEYLHWDPLEYGGLESVWIPAIHIWTPDIFINNFADESFRDFMDTYTIVSHTGEVLWMFPAVVKTYCTLDVRHFPFDHQRCKIVFISWTFHGYKLNVTFNETEQNAIYYKPKNQEWFVEKVTVRRRQLYYVCCPEPYPDVTFYIHMTRRSLFYVINLIFPCLLIYAVSFLGFFLPVESGEKVNLEITILLALVVFLLIVGETLPPTPDAIPALGLLFGLTMIMVSIALVMAVIVTNVYLRKDLGYRVPACLRKMFLRSLTKRCSLTDKITVAENHVNDNKTPHHQQHQPQHHLHQHQHTADIELDNLSILSEIETLTSCRHRCNNSSSRRRSGVSRTPGVVSGYPSMVDLPMEPADRYAFEWQQLAKNVDRFFFWLFLIASICALTTMFATVPQKPPPYVD